VKVESGGVRMRRVHVSESLPRHREHRPHVRRASKCREKSGVVAAKDVRVRGTDRSPKTRKVYDKRAPSACVVRCTVPMDRVAALKQGLPLGWMPKTVEHFYGTQLPRPYLVIKQDGQVDRERLAPPRVNAALLGAPIRPFPPQKALTARPSRLGGGGAARPGRHAG